MGDSWRDWFQSWVDPGAPAHPNSPWGGGGRGTFTTRDPLGVHLGPTTQPFPSPGGVILRIPHPSSPAARTFDWHRLPLLDEAERVHAVFKALLRARHNLAGELLKATGEEFLSVVEGIIPGLLLSVGIVAVTTVVGAAAGALLGALAFGAGAAPGAVAGAAAGAEAGLAILEYLGVAFLAAFVGKSMLEATRISFAAAEVAWHSVEHPPTADVELDRSAHLFARAVAEVFRRVLQGIVAFLMKEGIGAAKARMPELVTKLRASRLGEGFAKWVEAHWERLVRNKKLQPGVQAVPPNGGAPAQGGGAAAGGAAPPATAEARTKPPPPAAASATPKRKTSPEMQQKILYGKVKTKADGSPSREMIGAHSPMIKSDPNYSLSDVTSNADGTTTVTVRKTLPNGDSTRGKTSTLAPDNWSDQRVLDTTDQVGGWPGGRDPGARRRNPSQGDGRWGSVGGHQGSEWQRRFVVPHRRATQC
jgi:hypothetical protein